MARTQLAAFFNIPLKQAKEAVRIARTSFKFGEASLLDVLDAQRVLWHTFQGYSQARLNYPWHSRSWNGWWGRSCNARNPLASVIQQSSEMRSPGLPLSVTTS
jgi:hypothetical protein